jgi:hypothetical protein
MSTIVTRSGKGSPLTHNEVDANFSNLNTDKIQSGNTVAALTITALTTPSVQAVNSAGLALKNSAGTTQMSMGAGGGDNMSINVSTNLNGTNAQIDISPTGTGHVHINPSGTGSIEMNPTSVGTIDNMTIGATTAKNGSFINLSVTGTTSFDGSQGTSGQVLTSAGTGATPTWTTISSGSGTVTSVAATVPSFLSVSGSPITTSGTLALTYSGTALPIANGGTGQTTANTAFNALAPSQTSNSGKYLTTDGTNTSWATVASGNAYTRTSFTATAAQTTFTVTYTAGYVEVYVNGVLLNASDYTASNGTSVVLGVACNSGDIVETIAFSTFSVANTVSSFSAGSTGLTPSTATTGAVTLAGTLAVANGGTGLTSAGTSGNILVSNGTALVSTTPSGLAKAWVSYNGSGQTVRGSYNVSSVTYTASTVYTINFTTAFANTNYCAVAMSSNGNTSAGNLPYIYSAAAGGTGQDPTTTTLRITTSVNNPLWVNVAVFS